jgi:hypothetical protein
MAITPSKENILQKESTVNLPSRNPKDSILLENGIELESNTFWEKGTFIDFYI